MTYIREIDGKWYAFAANPDNGQVYSIGRDNPKDGQWFAGLTDSGIKYVASPCPSRRAAYMRAMRNGSYGGVL